jgi:ABC-type lipoprotein release transport system permease subunit
MRKIKMILLGGVLGGLLGGIATIWFCAWPFIREPVYSRLGYYMTYLPVAIALTCAIIGALIAVSYSKKR